METKIFVSQFEVAESIAHDPKVLKCIIRALRALFLQRFPVFLVKNGLFDQKLVYFD